jgi:CheY-like chemotaxis protein
MTDPPLAIPDETVSGLLLTRDLMFLSKVTGTAAALGFRIETVGAIGELQSRAEATRPRAVFIDLAAAEFDPRAVLERLNIEPRPLVIAFGSHVDVERLELARAAGCDEVLPRSRFSANLPELLRQIFRVEP